MSAASQRDDGAIELPPSLRGAASHKVVHKLLSNGLIEEVAAGGLLPVWRRDEEKGALALPRHLRTLAALYSITSSAAIWRSLMSFLGPRTSI
jgi:hypothetical protein